MKRRTNRILSILIVVLSLALLAGAGFSLFIETVQLIGRVGIFETDDLLFNTLGAILGFMFYKLSMKIFGRRRTG